jgi:hypothetical protein
MYNILFMDKIQNKHELYDAKYQDIEKYRNQALIGTMNISIGILITSIMLIKRYMS